MDRFKYTLAILALIAMSACDGGTIDNSYADDYFMDDYFEDKDDKKESWEIDYEEEVIRRVTLKETRFPEDHTLRLELWSSLPEVMDGVSFKYGVRVYMEEKSNSGHWITRAEDYNIVALNEDSEHYVFDNFIYDADAQFAMYYRSYNNLVNKLSTGIELTDSEQSLYKKLKEELSERVRDFTYDIFVEIYDVKYPVNGYWEENVEP